MVLFKESTLLHQTARCWACRTGAELTPPLLHRGVHSFACEVAAFAAERLELLKVAALGGLQESSVCCCHNQLVLALTFPAATRRIHKPPTRGMGAAQRFGDGLHRPEHEEEDTANVHERHRSQRAAQKPALLARALGA